LPALSVFGISPNLLCFLEQLLLLDALGIDLQLPPHFAAQLDLLP
jgi:hypothetical protein